MSDKIVLGVVLVIAGLLDGALTLHFGAPAFVSSVIHGALLALYMLENWVLLKDLQEIQQPTQITEHKYKELIGILNLRNLELERQILDLRLSADLKRKPKMGSWHAVWHSDMDTSKNSLDEPPQATDSTESTRTLRKIPRERLPERTGRSRSSPSKHGCTRQR